MTVDASAGVLLLEHSDVLVTVKRSFYDLVIWPFCVVDRELGRLRPL